MKNLIILIGFVLLLILAISREPISDTVDALAGATNTTYSTSVDDLAGATEEDDDDDDEEDDE